MISSKGLQHIFRAINENRRSELKLIEFVDIFLIDFLIYFSSFSHSTIYFSHSLSSNAIEYEGCRYITSSLRDNNSLRGLILDDNYLGTLLSFSTSTSSNSASSNSPSSNSLSTPSAMSSRDYEEGNETCINLIAEMLCATRKLAHLRFLFHQFYHL